MEEEETEQWILTTLVFAFLLVHLLEVQYNAFENRQYDMQFGFSKFNLQCIFATYQTPRTDLNTSLVLVN